MRLISKLLLTFLILLTLATPAAALETLGISPLRLESQLKPGDSVTQSVRAYNPGTTTLSVSTEIADFQENASGAPSFGHPQDNPGSAANWLTVEPSNFELKPGSEVQVQIRVKVPKDASPGGHYGAVLFQFGGGKAAGTGVGVSGRIAALNIVTIPGTVKRAGTVQQLAIPFFNAGYPVPIDLKVANNGNIHLSLKGTVEIQSWLGGAVQSLPLPDSFVFPNSGRELKLALNSGSLFGFYKAQAKFDDKSIAAGKPEYFIVFPWPLILGIILVAYGLYKLGVNRGRKTNPPPEQPGK